MITLAHYWRGRDHTHATLLSVDMRAEAARTVDLANRLLVLAKVGGVTLDAQRAPDDERPAPKP